MVYPLGMCVMGGDVGDEGRRTNPFSLSSLKSCPFPLFPIVLAIASCPAFVKQGTGIKVRMCTARSLCRLPNHLASAAEISPGMFSPN